MVARLEHLPQIEPAHSQLTQALTGTSQNQKGSHFKPLKRLFTASAAFVANSAGVFAPENQLLA